MNSVVSYSEAELNKKEEVIAPACQASLNEPVVATSRTEIVKPAYQMEGGQEESNLSAANAAAAVELQSGSAQVDGSGGAMVEEVTGPSAVTSAEAEQDFLMNQAIDDAVRQANESENDPYKAGPK
jgi:hypothetical protein